MQRSIKNTTINLEINQIRRFLYSSGVRLPKYEKLDDDSGDWELLTKEVFNFIS